MFKRCILLVGVLLTSLAPIVTAAELDNGALIFLKQPADITMVLTATKKRV